MADRYATRAAGRRQVAVRRRAGCEKTRARLRLSAVPNAVVEQLSQRARAALGGLRGAPARWVRTAREQVLALRGYGVIDWLELGSAVVVTLVFMLWLRDWYHGNVPALLDPKLTADDARTAIFPFHRYEKG